LLVEFTSVETEKINLQIQFPIKSAENHPVLKKSLILPL